MAGDPVPDRPTSTATRTHGLRSLVHANVLIGEFWAGTQRPLDYFVCANFADTPAFRTSGSDP
jgi:hypothetical protein